MDGLFFTFDTLKKLVDDTKKASSIPMVENSCRLWDLDAGIYKVKKNCMIYYNGATSTSQVTIKCDTIMILCGANPSGTKTFYIFDSPENTQRDIVGGYVTAAGGGVSRFNLNRAYVQQGEVLTKTNTTAFTPTGNYNPATKEYVDNAIQDAIGDALGGSY